MVDSWVRPAALALFLVICTHGQETGTFLAQEQAETPCACQNPLASQGIQIHSPGSESRFVVEPPPRQQDAADYGEWCSMEMRMRLGATPASQLVRGMWNPLLLYELECGGGQGPIQVCTRKAGQGRSGQEQEQEQGQAQRIGGHFVTFCGLPAEECAMEARHAIYQAASGSSDGRAGQGDGEGSWPADGDPGRCDSIYGGGHRSATARGQGQIHRAPSPDGGFRTRDLEDGGAKVPGARIMQEAATSRSLQGRQVGATDCCSQERSRLAGLAMERVCHAHPDEIRAPEARLYSAAREPAPNTRQKDEGAGKLARRDTSQCGQCQEHRSGGQANESGDTRIWRRGRDFPDGRGQAQQAQCHVSVRATLQGSEAGWTGEEGARRPGRQAVKLNVVESGWGPFPLTSLLWAAFFGQADGWHKELCADHGNERDLQQQVGGPWFLFIRSRFGQVYVLAPFGLLWGLGVWGFPLIAPWFWAAWGLAEHGTGSGRDRRAGGHHGRKKLAGTRTWSGWLAVLFYFLAPFCAQGVGVMTNFFDLEADDFYDDGSALMQRAMKTGDCSHPEGMPISLGLLDGKPTVGKRCVQTFFHHHLDANQFKKDSGSLRIGACLECQLGAAFEEAREGFPLQLIPVRGEERGALDVLLITTEGSFPGHIFLVDFFVAEMLDARGTVLFREGWDPFTTERIFELLSPANLCASSAICFVELAEERWAWPHPFHAKSGSRLKAVEIPVNEDEDDLSDCSTWLTTDSSSSSDSATSWGEDPDPERLTLGRGGSHPGAWTGEQDVVAHDDTREVSKEEHDWGVFMQLNAETTPPNTLSTRSPEITVSLASSGPPPVDRPLHFTNLEANICEVRRFLLGYWRGLPWRSTPQHLLVHCMAFTGQATRTQEVQCPVETFLAPYPFRDLESWCQVQGQPMNVDHFRVFPLAYEIYQNIPSLLMVENCRGMDVPIAVRYESPEHVLLLTYVATQSLQVHNIIQWVGLHADINYDLEIARNGVLVHQYRMITFRPGDLLLIRAHPYDGSTTETGFSSGSMPGSSQITWSSQEGSGDGSLQLQFPQMAEEEVVEDDHVGFFQWRGPSAHGTNPRTLHAGQAPGRNPDEALWDVNTRVHGLDLIQHDMRAFLWAHGRWPPLIIHATWVNGYFVEPMGEGGISERELLVAVRRAVQNAVPPWEMLEFGFVRPQPTPWQAQDLDGMHLLAVPRALRAYEVAVLLVIEQIRDGRSTITLRPLLATRRQNKWSLLQIVGLDQDCADQACSVRYGAIYSLGSQWVLLESWMRIDIEVGEYQDQCGEPLARIDLGSPPTQGDTSIFEDATSFLQFTFSGPSKQNYDVGTLMMLEEEDMTSFSQAPLDVPELPVEVAVLADWEVTRVWAAAVDAGFLRLFREPDRERTLTVYNLVDSDTSNVPYLLPWFGGMSFIAAIQQAWPELQDGQWDFQAFWPDTTLVAQPPGCVVVLAPQDQLFAHAEPRCWYVEYILQLEDHCASYAEVEFIEPEVRVRDVLARRSVTAQALSGEMRIEHNGVLLQPYHRLIVQHGDVLTIVVSRRAVQRLQGGRWDPAVDGQIAVRSMDGWQFFMLVSTYMREGEYLCLRPGRNPPGGMGILRGAINFYHDERWLRRQMRRLWVDFRERAFMQVQLHSTAYVSTLLQKFALLVVVDLGPPGTNTPVVMESNDEDSIPLLSTHILAFRLWRQTSRPRLLHIWRTWRQDEELRPVSLWHNGVAVEQDDDFPVEAGDYFFVKAAPRGCKRPRLDQQIARMSRQMVSGRSLMQRHRIRREVYDVYEVYQRYSPFPSIFRCAPGHWFTGLRSCILDHLGAMWLDTDRTNALILEVKPQPAGRQMGEKMVILAMSGSYLPTQSVILVGLYFSNVQYKQVLVIPYLLTRLQFIQELGLTKECGKYGISRCLIQVGFAPWEQQDPHARLLAHSSYLQVWVDGQDPGSCQDNAPDEGMPSEESDDQALLQVPWPGQEVLALQKLSPPGNPVRFHPWVEDDEDEAGGGYYDPRCDNDFWLEFIQGTSNMSQTSVHTENETHVEVVRSQQVVLPLQNSTYSQEATNMEEMRSSTEVGRQLSAFVENFLATLDGAVCHNTFVMQFCKDLKADTFQDAHTWLDQNDWAGETAEVNNNLPLQTDVEIANKKVPLRLEETLGTTFAPCSALGSGGPGIDFREACEALNWFNTHVVQPNFNQQLRWHAHSYPWIVLPQWQLQEVKELWFYLDGSKDDYGTGAAVTLWVWGDEWMWGGSLQHHLHGEVDAYHGEIAAQMMALKWVHDLFRTVGRAWSANPAVHFCFDSDSAAGVVFGLYSSTDPQCQKARALMHMVQVAHDILVEPHHTKAHLGHPGNEAADVLAKHAAVNRFRTDAFWEGFRCEETLPNLWAQSFWLLYRRDLREFWHGHRLILPRPQKEADEEVAATLAGWQDQRVHGADVTLKGTMMSCNALTLKQNYVSAFLAVKAYLHLCGAKNIALAALQETRLKNLAFRDDHYMIRCHPAERGHGGVMLALNTLLFQIIEADGQVRRIHEDQWTVVASSHRFILTRLWAGSVDLLIANLHVPHSGHTEAELTDFWEAFQRAIPDHLRGKEMILMGDFNARVGQVTSTAIGAWGGEEESIAGGLLHEFLLRQGLFLPATFEGIHEGPAYTWTHPNGATARLDYVAIPLKWSTTRLRTWNDLGLQAHQHLHDHLATCMQLTAAIGGSTELTRSRRAPPREKLDVLHGPFVMRQVVDTMAPIPWNLDMHQHAHELVKRFNQGIQKILPLRGRFHRKPYLATDTKDAIIVKAAWRKTMLQLQTWMKQHTLRTCFWAWAHSAQSPSWEWLAALESLMGRHWAHALKHFRQVRNQTTTLLRRDANHFFEQLKQSWGEVDCSGSTRELWQKVKMYLPKMQMRREVRSAQQQEAMREQWEPHLCRLEAGTPTQLKELYEEVLAKPQEEEENCVHHFADLPTLTAIEVSLRHTKPGKASGPDGLESTWLHCAAGCMGTWVYDAVLKMMYTMKEPIQWKGGTLYMLPKVIQPTEPSQFRGVMLLGVLVRRIHALFRDALMAQVSEQSPPGQLGGFPHQECLFGSLYVRTLMRRAYQAKLPSAILFVDLRAAFHSLVRELVLGKELGGHVDLMALQETLKKEGFEDDLIHKMTHSHGVLPEGPLKALMRELHGYTWSTIHGRGVRTARGSRPGSPLADALFHCLMSPIVAKIENHLQARPQQRHARETLGSQAVQVVWADDLAVPLLATSNADMEAEIRYAFGVVFDVFHEYGMTLNMSRGKTEVLVTYAGSEARAFRERLRREPQMNVQVGTSSSTMCLVLGNAYKHLGTTMAAAGRLHLEVKRRVGQAWGAFRQLARPVFLNKALKESTRIFLLETLVFTKLLYGCGSWNGLTLADEHKLSVCYLGLLRRTLGQVKTHDAEVLSDLAILQRTGCAPIMVRISQQRFLLAARVARFAPSFVHEELLREEAEMAQSWRGMVTEDLGWLHAMVDLSKWGTTLPALWEAWQHQKPGWQHVLRKAVQKYRCIMHLLHTAPVERGEEEETLQDLWMKVHCRCHCGQGFASLKALRMHQMTAHSWRTPISGYLHGATCPVCLRHYWTKNRLRIHLRYVSRKGIGNTCASWLQAFGVSEEAREDLPADPFVALKGACRVEAVQLHGPRVFGATVDDVATLEQEFLDLKDELERSGVSFHPDPDFLQAIGEECAQAVANGTATKTFYQQWEDVDMGILLGMVFL